MISYENYKLFHYISIFFAMSGIGIAFFGSNAKIHGYVTKFFSLMILVSGMGLLARLGNKMEPWVYAKMLLWGMIAIGAPLSAKRLASFKGILFYIFLVLAGIAAYVAINKPF